MDLHMLLGSQINWKGSCQCLD